VAIVTVAIGARAGKEGPVVAAGRCRRTPSRARSRRTRPARAPRVPSRGGCHARRREVGRRVRRSRTCARAGQQDEGDLTLVVGRVLGCQVAEPLVLDRLVGGRELRRRQQAMQRQVADLRSVVRVATVRRVHGLTEAARQRDRPLEPGQVVADPRSRDDDQGAERDGHQLDPTPPCHPARDERGRHDQERHEKHRFRTGQRGECTRGTEQRGVGRRRNRYAR
jgi:hypothetical protein